MFTITAKEYTRAMEETKNFASISEAKNTGFLFIFGNEIVMQVDTNEYEYVSMFFSGGKMTYKGSR